MTLGGQMRSKFIITIGVVAIIMVIIITSILSIVYLSSNDETKITVYPIVISTNDVYNVSQTYSMNYKEVHDAFYYNYSNSATSELQSLIIDYILEEAERIGEDPEELDACLQSINSIRDNRAWYIPCYVEKAIFEYHPDSWGGKEYPDSYEYNPDESKPSINESCWIVVMNVGSKGDMGHIEIFFISIETKQIMHRGGCD